MSMLGTEGQGSPVTGQMVLQMLVDAGLVPREFLPQDVTPAGVLTDSGDQSKPVDPVDPGAVTLLQPTPPVPVAKAARGVSDAEIDDGWREAVKWAEEAQSE